MSILDQAKEQLKTVQEPKNELNVEATNKGVDAQIQRDLPKQWTVAGYVKRLWENNDWTFGFKGTKKF